MTDADSERLQDNGGLLDRVARVVLGLSILLFVVVSVALLFERRALANALTMDALTVLSVGLVVRLLAFAIGDRTVVSEWLVQRLRTVAGRMRGEGSRIANRLRLAVPIDDESLTAVRHGVGIAIPLTLGGAGLVVFWDLFDPDRRLTAAGIGWLLVGLGGLCVVYAVLRSVERDPG